MREELQSLMEDGLPWVRLPLSTQSQASSTCSEREASSTCSERAAAMVHN